MPDLLTFTCAYKGCTTFVAATEILCEEHDKQIIDEVYGHQPMTTPPDEEEKPYKY
ncbi:hypothetical protein AAAC51_08120 [Priestia megaterium]